MSNVHHVDLVRGSIVNSVIVRKGVTMDNEPVIEIRSTYKTDRFSYHTDVTVLSMDAAKQLATHLIDKLL